MISPWWVGARCAEADIAVDFFPASPHDAGPAKAVCATCPVRLSCLAEALNTNPRGDHGVWGGLTEGDRRRLRRVLAGLDSPDQPALDRNIRKLLAAGLPARILASLADLDPHEITRRAGRAA